MKSLEELAMTKTSDIGDFVDQIIRDVVLKTAREKTIGRDLITVEKMPTGSDEIVYAISDKLTTTSYSEGGTVSTSQLSITPVTLTIDQYESIGIDISQKVIDDEKINFIKTGIGEMGEALVQTVDDTIIDTMLGKTTQTAEALDGWTLASAGYATLSLSNANILDFPTKEVYSGGNTFTVSHIDYLDGKIEVSLASGNTVSASTTPTYYYSALIYTTEVGTAGTIEFVDIVDAQYLVKGRYEDADMVLCSPRGYALFLKDDQFVRASYAGDTQAFRKGRVGLISGLEVVISTKVPDTCVLVFRKDRFTKMVERPVYSKKHDTPQKDSVEIYGYARFGIKRVFEGASELVLNIASDAKDM